MCIGIMNRIKYPLKQYGTKNMINNTCITVAEQSNEVNRKKLN